MDHHVHQELFSRPVRVLVVGTDDFGIASVMLLPHLHRTLLSSGHPGGLAVTLLAGDFVSHASRRTQPFRDADVGEPKSVVIVDRMNSLWGLEWHGVADEFGSAEQLAAADILVSCVTAGRKRGVLAECAAEGSLG